MKVAKYAGTNKVDLIENEEYGYCCLITAARRILDKLKIENKTFSQVTSSQRNERKLIDEIALREAFINAVAHSLWNYEVPPVVEIYSDRLTITSYGGLPEGLTRDNFFRCRSMPRNRELMRVLKDVGLVEHLGSGMGRILKAYDKSVFTFENDFIIVTFPFAEGFTLPNGNDGGNVNGNVKKLANAELILNCIRQDRNLTLDQIAELTKLSKRTVSREMKTLQDSDVIQRVGSPKTGYWIIK